MRGQRVERRRRAAARLRVDPHRHRRGVGARRQVLADDEVVDRQREGDQQARRHRRQRAAAASTRPTTCSGGAPRSAAASSTSRPMVARRAAHDEHDPGERERHLPDGLRGGAQPDEAERRREEQEHPDREDELGRHERQQQEDVRHARSGSAPAPHAQRQGGAQRRGDDHHDRGELEAVRERGLQGGVVEDAERRVLPEPAQRPALQRGARAPGVEGEADGQQHRQERPQDVDPRRDREEARAPPRVGQPLAQAACARPRSPAPSAVALMQPRRLALVGAHDAQVIEHEDEQEGRQQQGQRGAQRLVGPALHVAVDRVAEDRRLGRARDEVGRVVVAEHRQRDEHDAGQRPGLRERDDDAPEGARRRGAEVARGLDVALVDAIERGEERQDQVRHVAVDEREDHRDVLAAEPVGAVEQPELLEQRVDRQRVQRARRVAVARRAGSSTRTSASGS